ncbi:hypothetical protein [Chitinophaga silvisoli]|uniref:Uncharacterized protein n=1 Tax=Chitinophaga silvisoli TaxID=2291814 RepID=A0A3E1NRY5_9BACT|nr:hypothetical protein [Chitinophaga silvisoli]RFM30683.1 hypothetical protein DXN04_32600 [Chitinophaga silvisoli]
MGRLFHITDVIRDSADNARPVYDDALEDDRHGIIELAARYHWMDSPPISTFGHCGEGIDSYYAFHVAVNQVPGSIILKKDPNKHIFKKAITIIL